MQMRKKLRQRISNFKQTIENYRYANDRLEHRILWNEAKLDSLNPRLPKEVYESRINVYHKKIKNNKQRIRLKKQKIEYYRDKIASL